jgi:hypothetical protein
MTWKFFCFLLCLFSNGFTANSIPDEIRREYALKFHESFVLQSLGSTRRAYYCFKTAKQLVPRLKSFLKNV